MAQANLIASLALIAWLPLSIAVFHRTRPALAAGGLYLGAMLLLPERVAFDMPGIPPIDKRAVATIGVLLGALLMRRKQLTHARRGGGLEWVVLVFLGAAALTVVTNQDVQRIGVTVLPSLQPYDIASTVARDLLGFALPFFLGCAFFRSSRDARDLLFVLAFGGVIYSALVLVEVRMSPQLHRWVYGFHQHEFVQTIRFGAYRPMVFTAHGLALSLFMVVSLLATVLLARARVKIFGVTAWALVPLLVVVVVLCRSTGAWAYAFALLPVAALLRPGGVQLVASALATLVLAYPLLRSTDLFPTQTLVGAGAWVSSERARSLEGRFENEDLLIERALERPVFGWGGFSRARVFDPQSGEDLTVTDGAWIIWLGNRGVVGLVCALLLLTGPVLLAGLRSARIRSKRDRQLVSGLALVLALYAIDMLPNGQFTNLPFFLAGALAGVTRGLATARGTRRSESPMPHTALASGAGVP